MRKIDADSLKEEFRKIYHCAEKMEDLANAIEDAIDNAPTVERPQGKWIPVSKRLPNRNGVYNVTRIVDGTPISESCYFDGQNTWHDDIGVNHIRPYLDDIVAWQSLPEPYKEGGVE